MKPRRGVSEIVASMVVLVVVSVMGVMLYNISLGTMNGQQNNLLSEISFEEQKAQERFEIISVEYTGTRSIKVWLLNFSKENTVNVTISDVYINNLNALLTASSRTLQKNSISSITVTLSADVPDFTRYQSYNILVISERGVGNGYTWNYS